MDGYCSLGSSIIIDATYSHCFLLDSRMLRTPYTGAH